MAKKKTSVDAQATVVAEALGVDVRTVYRWMKRDGAPGLEDVEGWKTFAAENGIASRKGLLALKEAILEEQLELLKRKNEREAGRMIEEKDVQDFLRDWVAKFDQIITSEYEVNAPPQLVGKSVVEIRERMKGAHERIRQASARGLLNWKPEAMEAAG